LTTRTVNRPSLLFRRIPALEALRHYRAADARADLVAGLTVAAIAVPQAMAYALVAGVPVEHGLYTAIIMTAVGALLDSSRQLINGPTNAISIATLSALALVPVEDKLAGAVTLALLVGAFQTLITLLRLGDLTRYISHSVIVGFTAGAGMLLVLDQVKNLAGWSARGDIHDHFVVRLWHTWTEGGAPHLPTLAVGASTVALLLALRAIKRRFGWTLFPDFLLTISIMAALSAALGLEALGVKVVGEIPARLPTPSLPPVTMAWVRELSTSALAIALLGLLEAIAMAKAIAAQTGQKLDLNQQCLSEGLANVTGSFFQCIPGSGSLTRSAINQQAGAVSQWSGVISAVAVAIIVLLFAPWARFIPRSALAGMLLVSAFRMVDWGALRYHVRATHFDAAIVIATASAAVFISVEFCILIGMTLSFLLAVPRAGRMTRTEFVVDRDGVVRERRDEEGVDTDLLIFGLEGELFFGSTMAFEEHFDYMLERAEAARVVVLRVKRIRNPDAVGLDELQGFIRKAQRGGCRVLLSGLRPDLREGLRRTGLLEHLEPDQLFDERDRRGSSTVEAVRAARAWLASAGRVEPLPGDRPEGQLADYLV
jgi:SulP family sulfate permease